MNTTTDLTIEQQFIIVWARASSAVFSLIASVFIIGWMILAGQMRYMTTRLIFFLSTASFFESVANIMTIPVWYLENSNDSDELTKLCYTQGAMMQFFQIAEFSWTTVIAINLYLSVRHRQDAKFEKIYHVCVWVFASICAGTPFIVSGSYGFELWCWVSNQVFRWAVFYAPLICLWVIVIVLYISIYRVSYVKLKEPAITVDEKNQTLALIRLTRAFPAIFVLLYILPLINRIRDVLSQDNNFELLLLQVLTVPLLGFANAVAFCFSLRAAQPANVRESLPLRINNKSQPERT